MSAHDPILDGERPFARGDALKQAADYRTLCRALDAMHIESIAPALALFLTHKYGKGGAVRIMSQVQAEVEK